MNMKHALSRRLLVSSLALACAALASPVAMAQAKPKSVGITAYVDHPALDAVRKGVEDELKALGFTVVKPDGTFYIFPKALEDDAKAFCQKALQYDLALVPGDSFGCPGYFRMAYCIETEKVRRSFAALEKFVAEEYGVTKH